VITAIGPVHLERMGSEEKIAAAKSEVLAGARVAVLNVDNPHLARIAGRLADTHPSITRVWRCSALDRRADVCVVDDQGTLRVFARSTTETTAAGHEIARADAVDAPATNVACAVAVALELGVTVDAVAARLGDLPTAPHRRQLVAHRSGATVIDDTYNANPAGAAAALQLLARLSGSDTGRRIVVTPGMVELGNRQVDENAKLGEAAAKVATDLVVVGQTNASALLAGVARSTSAGTNGTGPRLVRVATRDQAVAWVSEQVKSGDAVLYENDLPDHFP
jgi:UDP-N-acetylmuramoyl-tripeptide--D-alanyl-D-alanine ligase